MNERLRERRIHEFPEHSARCLGCACSNVANEAGQELLRVTDALTSAGVLAAVFIADSIEHERLLLLALGAIQEQRRWCDENGPFRTSECGIDHTLRRANCEALSK